MEFVLFPAIVLGAWAAYTAVRVLLVLSDWIVLKAKKMLLGE